MVPQLLIALLQIFLIIIYVLNADTRVCLEWVFCSFSSSEISFPVFLDFERLFFLSTVLFITRVVSIFSASYISEEKFSSRFHLLLISFVVSILLLIVRPRLLRLILGWDGLGVTSFLLVIYFQSRKSYNAGILTALSNRVGDVLILRAIGLALQEGRWNFWVTRIFFSFLLATASITKRAQIPFRAWLPAAIAAPTPVSSLVHSSTLVTAGVYIICRYLPSEINQEIFLVGVLTTIIAGLRAIKEFDLKKIVALSTLRQLGLIFSALGIGLTQVAFFHLVSHAFFKAMLFLSVGRLIHLSSDYQDLRKISLSGKFSHFSLIGASFANMALCGLPFVGAFFSKDIILEGSLNLKFSMAMILLLMRRVALTVRYSIRILFLISQYNVSLPVKRFLDTDNKTNASIIVISTFACCRGALGANVIFKSPIVFILPTELKIFPIILVGLSVIAYYHLCNHVKTRCLAPKRVWNSLWNLPRLRTSVFVTPSLNIMKLINAQERKYLFQPKFFVSLENCLFYSRRVSFSNFVKFRLMFLILFFVLYLCIVNFITFFKFKS